jgi:hypothetical protein
MRQRPRDALARPGFAPVRAPPVPVRLNLAAPPPLKKARATPLPVIRPFPSPSR